MAKTILIADDHPLFREALRYIVESVISSANIQEAINYKEAKKLLDSEKFDLVFLDLNMPDSNGLTDLALLKKVYPQIPMVVVSAHEEPHIIRACIDFNASGYIIKSSSPAEIKLAITKILEGETYQPESISLRKEDSQQCSTIATGQIENLTPSQLKILIEIGKGKLNKQIAYDLDISEATVKAHITSVFKKLGINNRTQAVLFIKNHEVLATSLNQLA